MPTNDYETLQYAETLFDALDTNGRQPMLFCGCLHSNGMVQVMELLIVLSLNLHWANTNWMCSIYKIRSASI